jgi:cell wall-associated NlpC family hydrolase
MLHRLAARDWRAPLAPLVAAALLAACATTPPRPAARDGVAAEAAAVARAPIGRPYDDGGETPGEGFDCSGLVHYAYARAGREVPRTTRQQYDAVHRLYLEQLQPGHLVFFSTSGGVVSHVGVYVGDSAFVHAPKSGAAVRTSSLDQPYWRARLVRAGALAP